MTFFNPFAQQPPKPLTARERALQRLSEGVPPELVARSLGVGTETFEHDREAQMAIAEGEIKLFEQARDSGVTGIVRAAMRYEAKTWNVKAETPSDKTLEDYLRD